MVFIKKPVKLYYWNTILNWNLSPYLETCYFNLFLSIQSFQKYCEAWSWNSFVFTIAGQSELYEFWNHDNFPLLGDHFLLVRSPHWPHFVHRRHRGFLHGCYRHCEAITKLGHYLTTSTWSDCCSWMLGLAFNVAWTAVSWLRYKSKYVWW